MDRLTRSIETRTQNGPLDATEVSPPTTTTLKHSLPHSTSFDGQLVKKLKLKIKAPSFSKTNASSSPQPQNFSVRTGYGKKNLARAKELSRLKSSSLEIASSEQAKQRIESQIPVNLFWSHVDPFFSSLTEEDFKFLKENELDESLFLIPRPGYCNSADSFNINIPNSYQNAHTPISNESFANNSAFFSNSPSPNYKLLSMRIITLLLEENLIDNEEEQEFLHSSTLSSPVPSPTSSESKLSLPNNENFSLENVPDLQNRIMQELSFINLPAKVTNFQPETVHNPVDESFRHLKCLQYCLRAVHAVNTRRKEALYAFLKSRMASMEYYSILDELDKQIENAYTKRYRPAKKKKRTIPIDIALEHPELMSLMNKRAGLVRNFSSVVMPRHLLSIPISSDLFIDGKEEEVIAFKFEIPSLSDADARNTFGIEKIVNES